MNVSLTPQLERLVKKKVKSGNYQSASEVVREALRLMQDRDRVREQRKQDLKRELQRGLDQLDQGEGISLDEPELREFIDDVKARGRRRLASRSRQ